MDISSLNSIGSNRNYLEETLNEKQNVAQANTKAGRDALNHPSVDTTKTAQTATDIVISSGKNLNQIVIENSVPGNNTATDIDKDESTNRNLGTISTTSAIGTQAEENALPSEINAKSEL